MFRVRLKRLLELIFMGITGTILLFLIEYIEYLITHN